MEIPIDCEEKYGTVSNLIKQRYVKSGTDPKAAAPGTTIRGIAVLRTATGTIRVIVTTIWVFGWRVRLQHSSVSEPVGWNLSGVCEESRSVPVMRQHPKSNRVSELGKSQTEEFADLLTVLDNG